MGSDMLIRKESWGRSRRGIVAAHWQGLQRKVVVGSAAVYQLTTFLRDGTRVCFFMPQLGFSGEGED